MNNFFETTFKINATGSSIKTEIIAGITTFLTMSYITMVNPSILADAGMDKGAVFVATCLAAALGCMMMGFLANYPVALAPGMGLNAFFTYAVVIHMQVPWQVALAAVFVSGILFILFSFMPLREAIVNSMPMVLKFAISAGIGLFLALIAFKNSGIIVSDTVTSVKMGNIHSPEALLAMLGFFLIIVLDYFQIRGAIIISILTTTFGAVFLGLVQNHGIVGMPPSIAPTFMQLDFSQLFSASLIGVIFVFFLVDLFDSTGTLVGVTHRAGLLVDGKLPRLKKALFADSTAIVAGAVLGTSSTTAYVESASGVAAGGKTGLTAIVVGVLFLLALWFSPLAINVPLYATAPALLYVGILMVRPMIEIDWSDITEATPAFLTIVLMPFSYSIANGIAVGFISYAIVKLCCGKAKTVPYMVWIVALIWLAKYYFLGV